jgi:hypothetical protein
MSPDDERRGLVATLARWNIDGRLDTILPLLSTIQLRDLLMTLDAVHQLGFNDAETETEQT